jgi:lipopolysaccharide/colanic/teichoic acid biosynthesis glycosyltransferase
MMHSQETTITPRFRSVGATSKPVVHNSPVWKRLMDISFICLSAPVVLPIMAVLAAYIKLVSKGPIFFTQERVGFQGSRFTCYKFRSMKPNADVSGHKDHTTHLIRSSHVPMIKLDATGDSRLIPFGSLIRASGVDELPQLLNVLKGEMSLVGPRPCVPYEYENYMDWQKKRFNAVPGLTGLWQVSGKNLTTFNEMINMDIQYGQNLSLWQDLKIIAKTIPALFALAYRTKKLTKARAGSTQSSVFTEDVSVPSK